MTREVSRIYSIQGYDLGCASAIIGENNRLDRNSKVSTTDEELAEHHKNISYVMPTRGIYGVHVHAVSPEFGTWLRGYFGGDI